MLVARVPAEARTTIMVYAKSPRDDSVLIRSEGSSAEAMLAW